MPSKEGYEILHNANIANKTGGSNIVVVLAIFFSFCRTDGRTNGWTDEQLDGWTDGRTYRWMNQRTDGWMDELTDNVSQRIA